METLNEPLCVKFTKLVNISFRVVALIIIIIIIIWIKKEYLSGKGTLSFIG